MKVRDVEYFVGLDLGQKQSFSAIVVVERSVEKEEVRDPVYWTLDWREDEPKRAVRHVERVPLGTSYVDVAANVRALVMSDALRGRAELIVDATGAGAPVVDLFREFGLREVMTPVLITAGGKESSKPTGEWCVPRENLLGGLIVLFEEKKLEIARGLPEARVLVEELVRFGQEPAQHDDLVMALALACWGMGRGPKKGRGKTAKERRAALEFVAMIMGVSGSRRM